MNLQLHLSTMFETPEIQETFEAELFKALNVISFNGARKIFAVGQYGNAITLRFNPFRNSPREHYKLTVGKIGEVVLDKVENPFSEHLVNEKMIGKTCMEKRCEKQATNDYNGHGHFVCKAHYDSLSNHFDNEYQ